MPIVGTSRLRSRNKFRISQLVSAISRQLLIAIGAEAARVSPVPPDQNDQPLAACDAGVEKIPLQHDVVLRHDRNDHGGIFRALAFMDGHGIGRHQHIEFAKPISDGPTIEVEDTATPTQRFATRASRRQPPCRGKLSLAVTLDVDRAPGIDGRGDADP